MEDKDPDWEAQALPMVELALWETLVLLQESEELDPVLAAVLTSG